MEITMITGCTSNYLGVDGVREVDMTDEQRQQVWNYIAEYFKQRGSKGDDLNQLLQWMLHQWGEWNYGDIVCECCGDTVDDAVLRI